MGNNNSTPGGSNSKGSGSAGPDGPLQSYPSFSRSDTKESSRSFRSLGSKIRGSKSDSPRNSQVLSNGDTATETKTEERRSSRHGRSSSSRLSRSELPPLNTA